MTDLPRILTQATKERVENVLAVACGGWRCDGGSGPTFVRRATAHGVVTVHIQCDGCGRSRSGALKRADFAYWQDFPKWDDEKLARHRQRIDEHVDGFRDAALARRAEAEDAFEKRRREYREWLATSSEWRSLRWRVLTRATRTCEACLNAPANDVHHLTYQLGRLPPAWELRAVCRNCHNRLHDWVAGEG